MKIKELLKLVKGDYAGEIWQFKVGFFVFFNVLAYFCASQGYVWVLEPEKVPKEKFSKEQKKKKEFLEVYPVRKYAKIKHRALILTSTDGSQTSFLLKGCEIKAVSASSLSSRKWYTWALHSVCLL